MERVGGLTMPDYGLRSDDIRYFKMDTVIRGRGADRLKYLDLEGRWVLNGRNSIPFINSAFKHLGTLNDALVPMRDITDQPLNAIGMVGWTKSSQEPERKEKKTSLRFQQPPVVVEEEVPPSPREPVPHRSAGYGPAHHKRKLSIPDRSRSASPARNESPLPDFDKFAKYQRKDSISSMGRYGNDGGYMSSSPSPRARDGDDAEVWVPPHRTQPLTPRPASRSSRKHYDTEYDASILEEADRRRDELEVNTKWSVKSPLPYRTHGYGTASSDKSRKYDISPRSIGSYEDSSSSEQNSPRNADEILVMAYHMSKHSRAESPRVHRQDWIRH